jgi:hypothetical protein
MPKYENEFEHEGVLYGVDHEFEDGGVCFVFHRCSDHFFVGRVSRNKGDPLPIQTGQAELVMLLKRDLP